LTTEEARYWDAVAEVWQRTSPQSLWRAHSDAVNAALLAQWLPNARVERLLKTDLFDEAFGEGLYAQLVRSTQLLVGIDLLASIVRADRARYAGLQVAMADVRRLPFASSSFDVIVSNSTLDHFRASYEIGTSLCELHRVLRVGGQLLLTLDNPANPVIALRNVLPFRWLNRLGLVPYYVGATYGPRRLPRILERVGFDIAEVRLVMHCPRVVAVKLAQGLEGWIGPKMQRSFLRCLMTFEGLSHWPTRFLTGYFVAVKAMRR
jgi:SAM-dependent methyltransferase